MTLGNVDIHCGKGYLGLDLHQIKVPLIYRGQVPISTLYIFR